jgi:hypothetical protein
VLMAIDTGADRILLFQLVSRNSYNFG